MTNPNLTEIVCVIDKSGSMCNQADETIGSFNSFVAEQRDNVAGEAKLTLVLFDTNYRVIHEATPLADVPELDNRTYRAGGATALLDAVGRTIADVGYRLRNTPEAARPGKVVVVVITDGQENSSREYLGARTPDMVKHQQDKYNWEFIYLGVDLDEFDLQQNWGIKAQNIANVRLANTGDSLYTYNSLSKSIGSYRTIGETEDMAAVTEAFNRAKADGGTVDGTDTTDSE